MKNLEQIQQENQIRDARTLSLFSEFGFSRLTEIQKKSVPYILQKKDCLIVAPTGSGKTECSVIPVFSKLKNSKINSKIKALYVTPLRALNRDVFRRITKRRKG